MKCRLCFSIGWKVYSFSSFYFDNIARKVLHSNEHNMCAINSYESTFIQAAVKWKFMFLSKSYFFYCQFWSIYELRIFPSQKTMDGKQQTFVEFLSNVIQFSLFLWGCACELWTWNNSTKMTSFCQLGLLYVRVTLSRNKY